MKPVAAPNNVDIRALAQANAQIAGGEPLLSYPRLAAEILPEGAPVDLVWEATFETRPDAAGILQPWLHLLVTATLSLTCQRCLGVVGVPVVVDRWFRFVNSEEVAELEDEAADEDLLVLEKQFKLHDLIEDEVLMAMPLVPRHEVCPGNVKLSVVDPDFEAAQAVKPKPFEALAALKKPNKG